MSSTQTPPRDTSHPYSPLPAADQKTVDSYLEATYKDDKRVYRCMFQGCQKGPFTRGENARVHVQKHLGNDKLFYCRTCFKQFSSEDNAKRHRGGLLTGKIFPCASCQKMFNRKDYRDCHQRKCGTSRTPGQPTQATDPKAESVP